MTSYDTLSADFDAGRIGYANELYTTIGTYGVTPAHKIIDIACGTGLGAAPLIANNHSVTGVDASEAMLAHARQRYPSAQFVQGRAEALPFDAGSFDAALCAQAFHQVDRSAALAEILRVLRPNGIVAIWWKTLMYEDPVNALRREVIGSLGATEPASGLTSGFKEFYAAPLRDQTLRVIPWRTSTPLSKFMRSERSRKTIADALGERADAYFVELEARLRAKGSSDDPIVSLTYTHFLYLGKK